MWLTLAFRPCSDILHMRYDLLCLFYNFLQILPQELFGLLWPRTVPFANHSKFLWGQGIKTEVLFGFQNFQIVTHRLLGCQFFKKYRIFHFSQFFFFFFFFFFFPFFFFFFFFLMYQKIIQGILKFIWINSF